LGTTAASPANPPARRASEFQRLVLIDDDELTLEVLTLLTAEAGFVTSAFASGEAALAYIAGLDCKSRPDLIVTDMQMPGLAGGALAEQLRTLCGSGTPILAMSGSQVDGSNLTGFDGFLLKPFSAEKLLSAASSRQPSPAPAAASHSVTILDEAIYSKFADKMPPEQVAALYKMCLADAVKRIGVMRRASEQHDDETYRRAAHAIKGGCGMVGATELSALASEMEARGLPATGDSTRLESFLAAAARLERMLEDKAKQKQSVSIDNPTD
jgi:CheY-like chemotaxis protein